MALVFKTINPKDFLKLDDKAARAEYLRAYGKVCARVLQGEKLEYTKPEQPKRIEYEPTEQGKERGNQCLSEIRLALNDGKPTSKPKQLSAEELEIRKAEMVRKLKELEEKNKG